MYIKAEGLFEAMMEVNILKANDDTIRVSIGRINGQWKVVKHG